MIKIIQNHGYDTEIKEGILHSFDDLPAVIRDNGKEFYYVNGEFIKEIN